MSVSFPRGAHAAIADFTTWLRRQPGSTECRGLPHRLEGEAASLDGERHDDTCCFTTRGGPFLSPPRNMTHDEALNTWAGQADEELIRQAALAALDDYRSAAATERDGSKVFTPERTRRYRAIRQAWRRIAVQRGVEQ